MRRCIDIFNNELAKRECSHYNDKEPVYACIKLLSRQSQYTGQLKAHPILNVIAINIYSLELDSKMIVY